TTGWAICESSRTGGRREVTTIPERIGAIIEAAGPVVELAAGGETKLLPARKTTKRSFCFVGDSSIVTISELPGWIAKNLSAAGNSTRVTPEVARPRRMMGFSFPLTTTLASPERYSGDPETMETAGSERSSALLPLGECLNLCDLLLFCVSASVGHAISVRRNRMVATLAECINLLFGSTGFPCNQNWK